MTSSTQGLVSIVVHCPRGSHFSRESVQRVARDAALVEPGRLTFELVLVVAEADEPAYRALRGEDLGVELRLVTWSPSTTRGAALCRGFRAARGELVLVQDVQLAYSPSDYPVLLGPILRGDADVVFGSRFTGHSATRVLHYWHSLRNRRLTTLSNMTTNLNLTDIEACQRAFRSEVLRGVELREDGLAAELELVARLAKMPDQRIFEVGIGYAADASEDEKRLSLRGTVRAVACILRHGLA